MDGQQPLKTLSTCEAKEYRDWFPVAERKSTPKRKEKVEGQLTSDLLDNDGLMFLKLVALCPGNNSGKYITMLKWSTVKAKKVRERLVALDLISETKMNEHRQGGQSKVLVPTDKGKRVAKGK